METTTSTLERIDDIDRAHHRALAEDNLRTAAAEFRHAANEDTNSRLAADQRNGAALLDIVAEVVGDIADEEYQSDK